MMVTEMKAYSQQKSKILASNEGGLDLYQLCAC